MRIAVSFLLFSALTASAASTVLKERKVTFTGVSGTSLREFTLIEQKKKAVVSGQASYSTDVRIIYRTDLVSQLQDYAIVQFIRGCQFLSTPQGKTWGVGRHYFDGMVNFQHRDWSIDSDNTDPVYTSWQGNRWGLLRWNKNPASFNPDTATFVAKANPPHPVVFATDLPGSSTLGVDWQSKPQAKNSSLEFDVCLFRTSDLPQQTTPAGAGIDKTKAISCHQWDSKFVYDFARKEFSMSGPIDPFCAGANP